MSLTNWGVVCTDIRSPGWRLLTDLCSCCCRLWYVLWRYLYWGFRWRWGCRFILYLSTWWRFSLFSWWWNTLSFRVAVTAAATTAVARAWWAIGWTAVFTWTWWARTGTLWQFRSLFLSPLFFSASSGLFRFLRLCFCGYLLSRLNLISFGFLSVDWWMDRFTRLFLRFFLCCRGFLFDRSWFFNWCRLLDWSYFLRIAIIRVGAVWICCR